LVVLVAVGVAVFIATFDVNRLIGPAQTHVKATTGRDLMALVVKEVSLANASWAGAAPVATAKRIAVQLELVPLLSGLYEVIHFEFDTAGPHAGAEAATKTPAGR